jgi:putative transposase
MTTIRVVALERRQKERLESMLRKGRWTPRELRRARILLMADDQKNVSNIAIAKILGCHRETVRQVRNRFLEEDLDSALFDRPRSGQPRKLDAQDEAFVIATACSAVPKGHDHWELALLAERLEKRRHKAVSTDTIGRVLLRHDLKPWREKNVVHSEGHARV